MERQRHSAQDAVSATSRWVRDVKWMCVVHAGDANGELWERAGCIGISRAVNIEHDAVGVTQEDAALINK